MMQPLNLTPHSSLGKSYCLVSGNEASHSKGLAKNIVCKLVLDGNDKKDPNTDSPHYNLYEDWGGMIIRVKVENREKN